MLQIPKVRTNLYKSEITSLIHGDCTSFEKNSYFSARHLQSIEIERQNPSFPLFIQLVTMFHISVDQYIHPDTQIEKTTLHRRLDVLLNTFDDAELTIIAGAAHGICKAKEQTEE